MAHALTLKRVVVPGPQRGAYLERLRARRDHYARAGCTFSVFEETALRGAFIEFTEAGDARVLAAAHAAAPEPVPDAARVYTEVEIG